jgi:hypothetical protein
LLPADRIRAITANYFYWQGLRSVPFGVAGLLWATTWTKWWPAAIPAEIAIAASVVLALAAFRLIGSYYDRTFGRVVDSAGAHRTRSTVLWWVAYPLLGGSLLVDWFLGPPVFVSGIVWAAAILGFWWSTGRGRLHYPILAPMTLGLTFFPALGLAHQGREMFVVFFAWLGIVYIVAGLLDHRELARALSTEADS